MGTVGRIDKPVTSVRHTVRTLHLVLVLVVVAPRHIVAIVERAFHRPALMVQLRVRVDLDVDIDVIVQCSTEHAAHAAQGNLLRNGERERARACKRQQTSTSSMEMKRRYRVRDELSGQECHQIDFNLSIAKRPNSLQIDWSTPSRSSAINPTQLPGDICLRTGRIFSSTSHSTSFF